jgi:tetratricopeptide (TPR) repeat protein
MRIVLTLIVLLIFSDPAAWCQVEEDYVSHGNSLMQKGKFKDAIDLYSKAIARNNNDAQYYYNRGVAYHHEKKFQEAYDDFSKAIHYNEKYAEAYSKRSDISFMAHQYQESLNDLDMAIKYSPNDSIQSLNILARGGVRLAARNYKGGYEDCKSYYDRDSTSIEALVNMAMAKLELNEPKVALDYLFKVLSSHPNDTMVIMNIGYTYLRMEKFDSALVYLEKARALDPKKALTLNNIAYVKLKLGDVEGALKIVNASLKLYPENSYAYRNRALIYLEMSDSEKGCLDLRRAITLGFTEEFGREVLDLIEDNCTGKKK